MGHFPNKMLGIVTLTLVVVGFSIKRQDLPLLVGSPLQHRDVAISDKCKKNSLVGRLGEGNKDDAHRNCTYLERNDCNLF